MRTPNCACVVCGTPLYRRPGELSRVRHVACMEHRGQAQAMSGVTDAQAAGLSLGRRKGTNNRAGYRHRSESRVKVSASQKEWCEANPDLVAARGKKTRGETHYNWKGGASKLNTSIRCMTENRRWMESIKARDLSCVRCDSAEELEAHHITELSDLIEILAIRARDDARRYGFIIFNLENGETLCRDCHYIEHGRTRHAH
jgi:hypothetical protein